MIKINRVERHIIKPNHKHYNLLNEFYEEFEPMLNKAFDNMEKKKELETGENCPECNSPLVIRNGKYGKFTACSNYPKCKYIKGSEEKPEPTFVDKKCPKCGSPLILKKGVKGRSSFLGCSNFPKCRYIEPYKE